MVFNTKINYLAVVSNTSCYWRLYSVLVWEVYSLKGFVSKSELFPNICCKKATILAKSLIIVAFLSLTRGCYLNHSNGRSPAILKYSDILTMCITSNATPVPSAHNGFLKCSCAPMVNKPYPAIAVQITITTIALKEAISIPYF